MQAEKKLEGWSKGLNLKILDHTLERSAAETCIINLAREAIALLREGLAVLRGDGSDWTWKYHERVRRFLDGEEGEK